MERYLKPVRIKRAGLNLPLNPSIITKENGYHCQNQHLTFSLQSAVLPVSMVQWSFVMSLCKYSLCSLSSHLLNSSKAVQEQIFCFVNYTHSLVPRFFISIFSDFDGKKKRNGNDFMNVKYAPFPCNIRGHLRQLPAHPSPGQGQTGAVGQTVALTRPQSIPVRPNWLCREGKRLWCQPELLRPAVWTVYVLIIKIWGFSRNLLMDSNSVSLWSENVILYHLDPYRDLFYSPEYTLFSAHVLHAWMRRVSPFIQTLRFSAFRSVWGRLLHVFH